MWDTRIGLIGDRNQSEEKILDERIAITGLSDEAAISLPWLILSQTGCLSKSSILRTRQFLGAAGDRNCSHRPRFTSRSSPPLIPSLAASLCPLMPPSSTIWISVVPAPLVPCQIAHIQIEMAMRSMRRSRSHYKELLMMLLACLGGLIQTGRRDWGS